MTKQNCIDSLITAGISYQDAITLRRISMTLHRWHELECGDGNSYGSWCITRGSKAKVYVCTQCGHKGKGALSCEACGDVAPVRTIAFNHDEDGKPYLEHHHYMHGQGKDSTTYTPMADKERGALKRLAEVMSRYPGFVSYVQSDPRGCSLYIMTPEVLANIPNEKEPNQRNLSGYYSRGVAVFK